MTQTNIYIIATTPMCNRGHYSFASIDQFTFDPYLIMLSVKQGSIKYHFQSLVLLDLVYTCIYWQMFRVFANASGDQGPIPGWIIPKTEKWYLMPPYLTLSIIRYGSRVSGPIQVKEYIGVVVIEKEAFGSPLTRVTQFTRIYIYIYIYIYLNKNICKLFQIWYVVFF